jgi:transcriptional regulator with XRE-family HTH domain
MTKKNTIAALRVKQELEEQSLTGVKLSEMTGIPYHAIANIVSGKSSKVEKLDVIAKALGKPLAYFLSPDSDNNNPKEERLSYDAELHYKVLKTISDLCKKAKISLTKNKMDELVDFVYPRLKKDDPDNLIKTQTEALVNYILNSRPK